MGKRGADIQISKDDYDVSEGSGGPEQAPQGSYSKASAEELKRRRIIKTDRRKWQQAASTAATGDGSGSGSSNPFAGFSFGNGSTSAPAPSASTAGKPTFAMPTLPNYNTTIPTTASSPAPKISFGSGGGLMGSNGTGKGELPKLVKGFQSFIRNADGRDNLKLPVTKFMTTFVKLSKEANEKNGQTTTEIKTNNNPTSTKHTSLSTSNLNDKPTKPLFPPVSQSPAPVAFSFGSSSSPAASQPSSSTTQFSFGGGAAAPPAPAPVPFSFGGGAMSAPAPAPAPFAPTAEDGEEAKEEEPGALESADNDWNLVKEFKVKAHHHRDGVATKFGTGMLKLQQHRETPNVRRMVMRDAAGKVLLNLAISNGMKFSRTATQAKNNRTVSKISFFGLRDEKHGPEMFTMVCKNDELDSFHVELENLSK